MYQGPLEMGGSGVVSGALRALFFYEECVDFHLLRIREGWG